MKIFVWRNGWLGRMSLAYAETEQQAKELIMSCSNVTQDTFDLEFNNPPEIYDTPKAFVFWADVSDIDETAAQHRVHCTR